MQVTCHFSNRVSKRLKMRIEIFGLLLECCSFVLAEQFRGKHHFFEEERVSVAAHLIDGMAIITGLRSSVSRCCRHKAVRRHLEVNFGERPTRREVRLTHLPLK